MRNQLISLCAVKGGSGKSTVALLLANAKAFSKLRVAIVDGDPQGTLTRWQERRKAAGLKGGAPVFPMPKAAQLVDSEGGMAPELRKVVQGHDVTVLDLPGESTIGDRTLMGLAYSDAALIPMRATAFDQESMETHIIPVLDRAWAAGLATRYVLLPTMTHPLTKLETVARLLEGTRVEILPAVLPYRKALAEFPEGGRLLSELAKDAGPRIGRKQAKRAIGDADLIAAALLNILDGGKK